VRGAGIRGRATELGMVAYYYIKVIDNTLGDCIQGIRQGSAWITELVGSQGRVLISYKLGSIISKA
jgi:hypothetical protein